MMRRYSETVLAVAVFGLIIACMVGVVWFMATMEARSYRKFCDTGVTAWDALWLDLRIDECR